MVEHVDERRDRRVDPVVLLHVCVWGLAFKAHRLLYLSILGVRVKKKKFSASACMSACLVQEGCGALVVEHAEERRDRRVDPVVLLHVCVGFWVLVYVVYLVIYDS